MIGFNRIQWFVKHTAKMSVGQHMEGFLRALLSGQWLTAQETRERRCTLIDILYKTSLVAGHLLLLHCSQLPEHFRHHIIKTIESGFAVPLLVGLMAAVCLSCRIGHNATGRQIELCLLMVRSQRSKTRDTSFTVCLKPQADCSLNHLQLLYQYADWFENMPCCESNIDSF